MSAEAREAVARALHQRNNSLLDWDATDEGIREMWRSDADAALAALRPFIAAEIRAWGRKATASFTHDADKIADRITTTGDEQQ